MGTHYSHVTPADRMSIQALLQAKLNSTKIARKLGISRSTISREINHVKAKPTALAGDYQAGVAQARCQQRRRDAGAVRRKLGSDTQSPLWRTVIDGLRCRWSPQQIAGKPPFQHEFSCLCRADGSRPSVDCEHNSDGPAADGCTRTTAQTSISAEFITNSITL
jgi:IS30 family transposase